MTDSYIRLSLHRRRGRTAAANVPPAPAPEALPVVFLANALATHALSTQGAPTPSVGDIAEGLTALGTGRAAVLCLRFSLCLCLCLCL